MVKVDQETALEEFERFADLMDLDLDESQMTEDDLKGFEKTKKICLRAIREGHAVIDEEGQPVITLKMPTEKLSTVTLYEPTGSVFLARDAKKQFQDTSKGYAMLQAMAKIPDGSLSKMK